MNDLYLIGNGFDLAHGLKTSYNDFLLWYLNKSLQQCNAQGSFVDELIKINRNGSHSYPSLNIEYLESFFRESTRMEFSIDYNSTFFENLVLNFSNRKWVDIEYEYYIALVNLYKKIDKAKNSANDRANKEIQINNEIEKINKDLEDLNKCFSLLKEKLAEYFRSIKILSKENSQIEEILFEEPGIPETREREFFEEVFNKDGEKAKEEKLFVCFNYTPTMECYLKNSTYENNLIFIHGELNDPSNPIIFGYGDEMDPHYEKIENLNNNEFLKYIKSFGYFRTSNYQRATSFIEGEGKEFTVKILGHSCGLSDRILLNSIFEHPNCKAIKIYYYQKSETENDYFEKTQEISRHFKASGKGDMRNKIVPFSQSVPLLPFVPKN